MSAPASTEPGVVVKQEAGEHQYSKTAVTVNTGLLMDGKLAMMASTSRRTADKLFAKVLIQMHGLTTLMHHTP